MALPVRPRVGPRRHQLGELAFSVDVAADGVPHATCNRAPARAEVWHGLVFVNADLDALSFAETYPALEEICAEHPFEIGDRTPVASGGSPVAANWKIWVENASECYHCPTIHKHSFSDAYEVAHGVYEYRNEGKVLCQLTPPNAKGERFRLAGDEYRYWYLFPSTFLQMDDFYTSAGRVHPTGVESCITDGDSWLQPGLDPTAVAEWDEMWRMTMQGGHRRRRDPAAEPPVGPRPARSADAELRERDRAFPPALLRGPARPSRVAFRHAASLVLASGGTR